VRRILGVVVMLFSMHLIAPAAAIGSVVAPTQETPPPAAKPAPRVHVKGYRRKDGTYVAPHTRSYPRSHPKSAPKRVPKKRAP